MTIADYIAKSTQQHQQHVATAGTGRAFKVDDTQTLANDMVVVARAVTSDFIRAGIPVTADLTDGYKKQIDKLVEKMHAKRTPLNERVVVPYTAKLGEHNRALQAMKDPQTKEPLLEVVLAKGRRALYNPASRVVHPIPLKA